MKPIYVYEEDNEHFDNVQCETKCPSQLIAGL